MYSEKTGNYTTGISKYNINELKQRHVLIEDNGITEYDSSYSGKYITTFVNNGIRHCA